MGFNSGFKGLRASSLKRLEVNDKEWSSESLTCG